MYTRFLVSNASDSASFGLRAHLCEYLNADTFRSRLLEETEALAGHRLSVITRSPVSDREHM